MGGVLGGRGGGGQVADAGGLQQLGKDKGAGVRGGAGDDVCGLARGV